MILAILCSLVVGRSIASPIAANVWLNPISALSPLRQYHIQDGSNYKYSFTGPNHAKEESTLNGVTQGGYSYIDANGMLQTVSYMADDQNGFRVSASNLPQPPKDELQAMQFAAKVIGTGENPAKVNQLEEPIEKIITNPISDYLHTLHAIPFYKAYSAQNFRPEISEAELNLNAQDTESTKNPFLLSRSEADKIDVPKPDPSLSKVTSASSIATADTANGLSLKDNTLFKDEEQTSNQLSNALHFNKLVSLANTQKPIAVPMPYVFSPYVLPYRFLHSSLHHTQDSLGQYDYSYTGDSSAKTESRSLDGTTRGAYSYIDANGILQQVHYIADHNGFRVLATNLPEAK